LDDDDEHPVVENSGDKPTRLVIEDITPSKVNDKEQSEEFLGELAQVQDSVPAREGVIGVAEESKSTNVTPGIDKKIWDLTASLVDGEAEDRYFDEDLEGLD
jgi:hypothetical protein